MSQTFTTHGQLSDALRAAGLPGLQLPGGVNTSFRTNRRPELDAFLAAHPGVVVVAETPRKEFTYVLLVLAITGRVTPRLAAV
jgi:hypothetical protein